MNLAVRSSDAYKIFTQQINYTQCNAMFTFTTTRKRSAFSIK